MQNHAQMYAKKNTLLYHILVLVVFLSFNSCATPIAPTGGPRDLEGPQILETKPTSGTTNFEDKSFEFQFSEYVNRSSLSSNITIEPDLGIEYSTKWKKKKLIIEFEDKLPDSTTVILTLGGDISDTRGNKIGKPITLAVSTGDEIDKGEVSGRIRRADTGESIDGATVLLYRTPIDLTAKAAYQAKSDTGGVFQFSYLKEGSYQALYVDDRNRNKTWDLSSETAQPFSEELIELKKEGSDTLDVVYIIQKDTLAPKLQGVGLFSSTRMRLRFNENITIQDQSSITILDSLQNPFSEAYPLFISEKDPFVLFAESETPLDESAIFSLNADYISDESGNNVITNDIIFDGSAQEDTTLQRIIEHTTEKGVYPNQSIEIIYSAPITDPMIIDSIVVVEGDVSFNDWPTISIDRNKLYIDPQEQWIEGIDYQFLVWNPSTLRRQLLTTEIWDETELGEISIQVLNADSMDVYHFSIENEGIAFKIDSTFSNSLELAQLAPVSYTLKVFRDLNDNLIWDEGSISPFIAPEPYYIQRGITIQNGFTSEIIIQF